LVFAFVHSPEAIININKKVHLDHFHYRINAFHIEQAKNEPREFYIRTLDEQGRQILDFRLSATQGSWVKVTFPKSRVLI
jgi:hypothetical protein